MKKTSDQESLIWMQELRAKLEKEKEEDKKRTPLQRWRKRVKFVLRNRFFIIQHTLKHRVHFDFAPNHFVIGAIHERFYDSELSIYIIPCLRIRINL